MKWMGLVRFSCLLDGTVKAVFSDGTIVEVKRAREIVPYCLSSKGLHVVWGTDRVAEVIDREGIRFTLRLVKPIGYEEHMSYVVQFINLCFSPDTTTISDRIEHDKLLSKTKDVIKRGQKFLASPSSTRLY
ncbi:hypothetical protein BC829DRAFT_43180 [Chytridium lagenaria]|nr:hypothetical protein BC829DRAFT_43180 [Chytridium lagenaria]